MRAKPYSSSTSYLSFTPSAATLALLYYLTVQCMQYVLQYVQRSCKHRGLLSLPISFSCLLPGQTAFYENIPANQALWSFDIPTQTWQQRHPTGLLPDPHQTQGLAVYNGKAFALVNEPNRSKRLEVFELDLATWHWRKLPGRGTQPSCRRAASAVVMEVTVTPV